MGKNMFKWDDARKAKRNLETAKAIKRKVVTIDQKGYVLKIVSAHGKVIEKKNWKRYLNKNYYDLSELRKKGSR